MYYAQYDYDTESCFLCVVEEEIVIEDNIKFHSDNEQEVIDFCEKWNSNKIQKYYVYEKKDGLAAISTQKQQDLNLIDIFSDISRAEQCLKNFHEEILDETMRYLATRCTCFVD